MIISNLEEIIDSKWDSTKLYYTTSSGRVLIFPNDWHITEKTYDQNTIITANNVEIKIYHLKICDECKKIIIEWPHIIERGNQLISVNASFFGPGFMGYAYAKYVDVKNVGELCNILSRCIIK